MQSQSLDVPYKPNIKDNKDLSNVVLDNYGVLSNGSSINNDDVNATDDNHLQLDWCQDF